MQYRKETGEYILAVNSDIEIRMAYCPFCGEILGSSPGQRALRSRCCKHLKDLASKPNSSVKLVAGKQEYTILGSEHLQVCIFFCPVCGRKLTFPRTEERHASRAELARLAERFAKIRSIKQAVEQLGRPDFEHGPARDHFHWKGERLHVGYRRFLWYQRLAKTVDVSVVEWSDGTVDVKFLAKPRAQPNKANSAKGKRR